MPLDLNRTPDSLPAFRQTDCNNFDRIVQATPRYWWSLHTHLPGHANDFSSVSDTSALCLSSSSAFAVRWFSAIAFSFSFRVWRSCFDVEFRSEEASKGRGSGTPPHCLILSFTLENGNFVAKLYECAPCRHRPCSLLLSMAPMRHCVPPFFKDAATTALTSLRPTAAGLKIHNLLATSHKHDWGGQRNLSAFR